MIKLQAALPWSALFLPLLFGCQSADQQEPTSPRVEAQVEVLDRPQSSLTALIRVLEAIDALQEPWVEVRIRALECDTLPSRRQKPAHVRVVLDLTIYARDRALAMTAEEALLAGLEEEGRATARLQTIAPGRVRRVFEEMAWNAPRVHDERDFAGLVSISNSIQVEVFEPTSPAELTTHEGLAGKLPSSDVEAYIRSVANEPGIEMGALKSQLSLRRLRDNRRELSYRIEPEFQNESFGRRQIGDFLYGLESGSPGVRITHIEIAPSDPGLDVRHDLWSFEADLTLRLSATSASTGQASPQKREL